MAMARQSEDAAAFMPTSNDSLAPPIRSHINTTFVASNFKYIPTKSINSTPSGLSTAQCPTPRYTPDSTPVKTAMASTEQAVGWESDIGTMFPREHVSSASSLPLVDVSCRANSSQMFWHDMYDKLYKIHHEEKQLWHLERQKLKVDMDILEAKLAEMENAKGFRNDSGISGLGDMGGKENDKVYGDAATYKMANEKLRKLSNVSPGGSRDQSVSEDYNLGNLQKRVSVSRSVSARLASIDENAASGDDVAVTGSEEVLVLLDDHPLSPNTTKRPSANPGRRTLDDGHPIIPRPRSMRELLAQRTDISVNDGADEPPELKEPSVLTTDPANNLDTLKALDDKLTIVANNPKQNLPEVLRGVASISSGEEAGESAEEGRFSPGGVRLKTKRSMNFGAELGKLR